jgi:hypothetical protein
MLRTILFLSLRIKIAKFRSIERERSRKRKTQRPKNSEQRTRFDEKSWKNSEQRTRYDEKSMRKNELTKMNKN